MSRSTLILDAEVYRNFFYLGIKRREDGLRVGFEFSDRSDFDRRKLEGILRRNRTIGFNSLSYDLPIIFCAISGMSNADLKNASDYLIKNDVRHWQAERELGISIPKLDHIDLMETNPAVRKGLKALNASMHHVRLQELPYEHSRVLSHDEMDQLIEYCQFGDIDGTEMLFDVLQEPISLREAMRDKYDTVDLRSKSDAQVGETILKTEVERKKGEKLKKAVIPDGTTFRYQPPDWLKFETPYMQWVLDVIRKTDIVLKDGKPVPPKAFKDFDITFDGMHHSFGIGGLHSTEANRAIHSDEDSVLIDGDVGGQYPNIILKLGLYPKAMGPDFLPVYKSVIDARMIAKRGAKDAGRQKEALRDRLGELGKDGIKKEYLRLVAEEKLHKTTDKGLKIAVNGSYGKLGSSFSTLFAPHLMVSVTLTGQLSLLMLVEKAHLAGIPVVSSNTDGVIFKCPRSMFNGFVEKDGTPTDRLNPSPLQDIIEWWEGVTSFAMEFSEYRSVYSQAVNTYVAIKPDGSFKRKGKLANHWREELPWGGKNSDYDPAREGLKKAPAMTVCADAALGMILHNIPVEKTVRECNDIREFITITTVTGGATWGPGEPLYSETERRSKSGRLSTTKSLTGYEGEVYLGKVVRYYWAIDGNPILRVLANQETGNRGKVPTTEGCRPLMTLPSDFSVPSDIDYERYITEAYRILKDIGFYGAPEPKSRRLRLTKANRIDVLSKWMTAA